MPSLSSLVRLAALALVLLGVGLARPSAVAADNRAAAESEFLRGRKLMEERKIAEACLAFERSQHLDPQFGTQYNLAVCYERLDRLASAWVQFRELAQRDTLANRKREAAKRAQALEGRVPRLTIKMPHAVPGQVVERRGEAVTDLVDVSTPLDPGVHRVVASAPGYQKFVKEVVLAEGTNVTVEVPALRRRAGGDVAPAEPAEPGHVPATTAKVPADEPGPGPAPRSGSRRRLYGVVVGSAGVVAVGVGALFGVKARSAWNDATDRCGTDGICDTPADLEASQALVADARSAGTVSTALFIGGGVAVAAGVVLWLTAPSSAHELQLAPTAGADRGGVTLSGRF